MNDVPPGAVRLVGQTVVIGPPVAYYVYRDTKRRDRPHPLLWAVGLGLLGLLGLFCYLWLRGDFSGGDRDPPE